MLGRRHAARTAGTVATVARARGDDDRPRLPSLLVGLDHVPAARPARTDVTVVFARTGAASCFGVALDEPDDLGAVM